MQPVKGSSRASPKLKSSGWRRTPRSGEMSPRNVKQASEKGEAKSHIGLDSAFEDHVNVSHRMAKTLYFANKLPSTPRPSLPLTVLAVKSFTTEVLGNSDTLEFLDLELASQIGRNACVSPTALIMALVYLERLSNNNPNYLSSVKPSELFVISLLVASKFIQDDGEDSGIYNDEWAASSKIDLKQINRLELQFLDAINWNVNVNLEEFETALAKVERKLALNQGLRRGWFTYTEVEALASIALGWKVLAPVLHDYMLKVMTAACMAYTAMLATLLGSSFLGPQIFALTKTALISTSLFQSPVPLQRAQSSAFSTSVCANESFPSSAPPSQLSTSDMEIVLSILTESDTSVMQAFGQSEPNHSEILRSLDGYLYSEEKLGESWSQGMKILRNPFTDSGKQGTFVNSLGKYLLNLDEIPSTKRISFETFGSLSGEGIS